MHRSRRLQSAGIWRYRVHRSLQFLCRLGPWLTDLPISVTIGGQPATLLYVGTELYRPFGALQINARIPEGIGPGPQPVVLKIGENDNASQQTFISVR